MSIFSKNLPDSWLKTTLDQVAFIEMGQSPDSKFYNESGQGLPFFQGKAEFGERYPSVRKWCSYPTKVAESGDILISIRAPVGPTNIADVQSCIGRGLAAIRAHKPINQLFLFYYFRHIESWLSDQGTGSTFAAISGQFLRQIEVVLAPTHEQTRIVDKLEELLSDLDAGVAELKAAQKKLVQYRQSLLKAAVEGALTAEWRKTHQPEETGAQLLERILKQRRANWEAKQLAKFQQQGKTPPKACPEQGRRGWQDKYPEPVKPDTSDLPELPEGWVWASLGQLLAELTSGSRDWAPYYNRGYCVFVMAQNVRPWRPDFSFKQYVDPPIQHRDRLRSEIQKNDLLTTIVGANTGQVCRVAEPLDSHFVCQSVALLRLVFPEMAEYVNAVLNSEGHGQRQFREMNYGAGRPHLSFDQLESVSVPIPSLSEQAKIVEVLAESLLAHDQIESELAWLYKQSAAQRQNILKAAFSGQLVPQDPSDEPASVLLERIRAERAALALNGKLRKRSTSNA